MQKYSAFSWRDYIMASLSGALLALSFPKPGFSFLAWIAFVPLLLVISRKGPVSALKFGFVTGLTAYCGILYWLNIVMTTYGKLHWTVSFCLFLLLAAYLALYPAVVTFVVRRGEEVGISALLSFPVAWVAFEYIRAFLLSGFPWASLGYSQYSTLPLIQIADITGVYGPSFLIALANVVIYRIISGVVRKRDGVYPAASALLLLLFLLMTLGYGFHRLRTPDKGETLKVSLIQGNIPQDIKWDPSFKEQTVAIYEKLSRQACAGGGGATLWSGRRAPPLFTSRTTSDTRPGSGPWPPS